MASEELLSEPSSASLRRQRGGDDRLVRVHVGDGRDADALSNASDSSRVRACTSSNSRTFSIAITT
jgi:hypothetical protein